MFFIKQSKNQKIRIKRGKLEMYHKPPFCDYITVIGGSCIRGYTSYSDSCCLHIVLENAHPIIQNSSKCE